MTESKSLLLFIWKCLKFRRKLCHKYSICSFPLLSGKAGQMSSGERRPGTALQETHAIYRQCCWGILIFTWLETYYCWLGLCLAQSVPRMFGWGLHVVLLLKFLWFYQMNGAFFFSLLVFNKLFCSFFSCYTIEMPICLRRLAIRLISIQKRWQAV